MELKRKFINRYYSITVIMNPQPLFSIKLLNKLRTYLSKMGAPRELGKQNKTM